MPVQLMVILPIVTFLIFLLINQIRIVVDFDEEFNFKIKYLFFTFRIKNKETGNTKQTSKKVKKKEPKEKQKISIDQVKYFIELFKQIWDKTSPLLNKFRKKLIINKLIADLVVGTEDAAKTAIYYGEACSTIFPIVSLIEEVVKIKRKQLSIKADFNGESTLTFHVDGGLRVYNVIVLGVSGGIKVLLVLIKNPIHKNKRSDKNERTSNSKFDGYDTAKNP